MEEGGDGVGGLYSDDWMGDTANESVFLSVWLFKNPQQLKHIALNFFLKSGYSSTPMFGIIYLN